MSRAITITENSVGSVVHGTPITKLIGVRKIVQVADEGAEGLLITKNNNTENAQRKTVEDAATMTADMNAATAADVEAIALTVNRTEGELAEQASQRSLSINVHDFVEAFADPENPADSVVVVEIEKKSYLETYYVDEDLATIEAAINA
jgi:hypothetical protein